MVGLFTAGAGGRMAMTGRNLPGWMGRVRKRDELRIQRAPAAYFRAIGSMALSFGLFVALAGFVFLTIPQEPSATYIAAMLGFAGLFVGGLILSVVWLFVVSSRYKLFRWDKP